jgi:alkaline phosphatase D
MCRRPAFLLAFVVAATVTSFGQDSGPAVQRIAFGSCNREYKPQPLWNPIRECKPDVWIWLGDIVYGEAGDLAGLARRYQRVKKHAEYKALQQQCRVIGVWDDHDYGVSDGGKNNANKIESQRLLLDFLDEPPDSPRRTQAGVYAAYTFGPPGKRVKVILLDVRYFRDRPGPKADILGEPQWRWLEQQLTNSDADIHIIGSGTQVIASEHPYEKWADFPRARQRMFDLLAKTAPHNVLFISGDRHLGEISRMTDPRIRQTLYDVTSSGMTHHATNNWFHNFHRETNRFRCGQNFVDLNFGLLLIDWDAAAPSVTLQIRDTASAVRIQEKFNLALKPEPR